MGTKDLHTKFIGRPQHENKNQKPQQRLADLDAGTIGVDISTILYPCLQTPKGSAVFDIDGPKVPLYHAYQEVTHKVNSLIQKHQKDILLVFDNVGHPMKAHTQLERRQEREFHLDELHKIYRRGEVDAAILEEVASHRKALASPRVDFIAMIIKFCVENKIKYCSAPFEADWQLVSLQQQGLIKHIISSDGDLFVLGGDSIITKINYSSGACCVYNRESILQRESMGGGIFFKRDLPLLSCLAGNDYIDRLYFSSM